jgi:hypothetical protein
MSNFPLAAAVTSAANSMRQLIGLVWALNGALRSGRPFSFNDLILYQLRRRVIGFGHGPEPLIITRAFSKAQEYAGGESADSSAPLHQRAVEAFEQCARDLTAAKFSPAARIQEFSAELIAHPAHTGNSIRDALRLSISTANRWLSDATRAGLLRKFMVGNSYVYILNAHFETLQQMPVQAIAAANGRIDANPAAAPRIARAEPIYQDGRQDIYLSAELRPPF